MRGFTIVKIFGLVLLGAVTIVQSHELDHHAIEGELVRHLETIHGSVPDYEVVPVHVPGIQKRSASRRSIKVKAFGENINLWLNPTDGVLYGEETPIYFTKMTNAGPYLVFYNTLKAYTSILYEDLNGGNSLVITDNYKGRRSITGKIGSNLAIHPLPDHLVHNVTKYRRSLDGIPESEYDDHHYHIVIKMEKQPTNIKYMEAPTNFTTSKSKSKRWAPTDTLYPETLVIIDSTLWNTFGRNLDYLIKYMLAFWNAVDMHYRELENPKYRLNIAGFIIAEDEQVLQYMAGNRWTRQAVRVENALAQMGPWLARLNDYIPLDRYDIAVTMTHYKLCSVNDVNPTTCKIDGYAFIAAACNYKLRTSIFTDNAGYYGIHTAVHEIGHLLGAKHDSAVNTECTFESGHVMTPTKSFNNRNSDWSACSRRDFQNFINSGGARCLENRPTHMGRPLPLFLPGKLMSADEQCVKRYGPGYRSRRENTHICIGLQCEHPRLPHHFWNTMVADGTACGNGLICIHGQCITDYTYY